MEVRAGTETHKAIYGNEVKQNIGQALNIFGDYIKMAERFMVFQPLYYDKSQLWWAWNTTQNKWELVDEIDILNTIDEHLKIISSTKSQIKNEILEGLKRVARKNKPEDIPPMWIQFKDKIIDLDTAKEYVPTPIYFVTNPIPWEVGESDETPTIDKIFTEWVGSDYVPLLYEIMAYCMIPSYPISRIFCFLGSGMNGKSCYLELIRRFIGIDNTTGAELDNLMDNRFGVTKLHKKLVCFIGETNFNEMKKTSILKSLCGNDLISFEYKNKTPFDDYNYAKLLIATNNLPTTNDKTIGFYRRWILVDFPRQFNEKKDILDDIPEQEYRNLACKCISILNKILTLREFHLEGTVDERMKRFEDRSNPFNKFMEECVEYDFNSYIFKHDFRKRLDEWCTTNHFRRIADNEILKGLKDKSKEIQRQAEWQNQEGKFPILRAWECLKWK